MCCVHCVLCVVSRRRCVYSALIECCAAIGRFDGGYYKTQQETAGDAGGKFGPYNHLGPIDDPNGAIE